MDRRKIKTKAEIKNAYYKLIEKKSANKITVTEIAKAANIERKTFYLHYACIEDIYLDIENDFRETITSSLTKYISNEAETDRIFDELNKLILSNMNFFKAISRNDSYSFFLHMLENILTDAISIIAKEIYMVTSPNLSYYTKFYSAGIIKIYFDWLKGDSNLSIEDIRRIVTRSCFLSLKGLLETDNK